MCTREHYWLFQGDYRRQSFCSKDLLVIGGGGWYDSWIITGKVVHINNLKETVIK